MLRTHVRAGHRNTVMGCFFGQPLMGEKPNTTVCFYSYLDSRIHTICFAHAHFITNSVWLTSQLDLLS
jgi:hypothetical protein